ncbi:MAG: hypothetical protein ACJAVI_003072 [Candidatus Azotimanducaceae bacterium]
MNLVPLNIARYADKVVAKDNRATFTAAIVAANVTFIVTLTEISSKQELRNDQGK